MQRALLASSGTQFSEIAGNVASGQGNLDQYAVISAYKTDFFKKVFPASFPTQTSEHILEHHNSAQYALKNAKQIQKFTTISFVCFMEPALVGCDDFNEMSCYKLEACGSPSSEMALGQLCVDGATNRVVPNCFVIALREEPDGGSRDTVLPWNSDIQRWMDDHNCTSVAYHLRYRCFYNLMKWDDVHAEEKWLDMDRLFDSAFGFNAIGAFNDREPLQCSALLPGDQNMLFSTALIHAETALLSFVSISAALAKFGAGAADVLLARAATDTLMFDVVHKLRAILLLNLFYDGILHPLREIACALNACIDYHPMHSVVDKHVAYASFYPGGTTRLAAKAAPYAAVQHNGTVHPATGVAQVGMDAYMYSVLRDAPAKAVFQVANGDDLTDIESF